MKGFQEFQHYISGLLFIGFALLLLAVTLHGSINYYLSPTMHKFAMMLMVGLFLLGISQIWRSLHSSDKSCDCQGTIPNPKRNSSLLLLLLIIILGFVLPDYALSNKMADLRGISYTFHTTSDSFERNYDLLQSHYDFVESKLKADDDVIRVHDGSFLDVLGLLHFKLEDYLGAQMEWTGFVHHDPALADNEWAIARFSFTCCVADAIGYGLIVSGSDELSFPSSGWVQVKGTIDKKIIDGNAVPTLQIESLITIEEPNEPYVYPTIMNDF